MKKRHKRKGLTLEQETNLLRDRIAGITLAWSDLENALAYLFGRILDSNTSGLSSAILFAPTSLEARTDIVSAAFKIFVSQLPDHELLLSVWNKVVRTMSTQRIIRNRVAHGSITKITIRGDRQVSITAPMFDHVRFNKQTKDESILGLTADDLEQSIATIKRAKTTLLTLQSLIRKWRHDDMESYAQMLPELLDIAQIRPHSGDTQASEMTPRR